MIELTAVILTLNESTHIQDCIESLRWADRVLVFDSFSQDNTLELARSAGAEVAQSRFKNYAQQRNAALDHLTTDWVLFIDADERATPEVAEEVRSVVQTRPEMGWEIPRHNYIFGNLTLGAGWYPDYQARLFKHGRVRYDRDVHEVAAVDGQIGQLKMPLIHHNYVDGAHFHAKQIKYTEYDAGLLFEQGTVPKFHTPYTMPFRHFWWRYVTLKGYRDGLHGLRLSGLMGYYEWVKYQRLLQMRAENESND